MLYLFLPFLALKFVILHIFSIFWILAFVLTHESGLDKTRYRQLPSLQNDRLQLSLPVALNEAHVADLIDSMTKQWDLSHLNYMFLPHKVSSILSIPFLRIGSQIKSFGLYVNQVCIQ